jgi:hypothetical protein
MTSLDERELDATAALRARLAPTRVGHRWERIMRHHAAEIDALMAVHRDLRSHVGSAVRTLSGPDGLPTTLDDHTVAAVSQVLDDLQRLGDFELRRTAAMLDEEIAMSRGLQLDDVLRG